LVNAIKLINANAFANDNTPVVEMKIAA